MTRKLSSARPTSRALRLWLAAVIIGLPVVTQPLFGSTTAFAATPPHVMVVVMEDQGYNDIIGNSQAPYINALAGGYHGATNWFGLQHSSLADYVALISGTTGTYSAPTVVDEMAAKGISWKAYMEDAPTPCYLGTGAGNYSKVHNPFVHFKSITGNSAQCNRVVPFAGNFANDFNTNTAPSFAFVVPNQCNNMHSGCGSVSAGDTWLSQNLPTVFNSPWWANGNGIVIITWDAAKTKDTSGFHTGNGGHVPTIVVASPAKGPFTPSGNHYGTLRAIEETYGLGLLGASADPANGDLRPQF